MCEYRHTLMRIFRIARGSKRRKPPPRVCGNPPPMPHTVAVEPLEPRVLLNGHPTVLSVQINDGQVQRSMVTSIAVQFSGDVSGSLSPSDLRLENIKTRRAIAPLDMAVAYNPTNQTATFTFPSLDETGRSLPNGNYTATLIASGIRDNTGQALDGNGDGVGGDNFRFSFYRLFGDLDGDRDVGPSELLSFRETWDRTSTHPQYNPALDSDGDGDVGPLDLLAFRDTFDTTLKPPPLELGFIAEFGSEGSSHDEFDHPTDLAINPNHQTLYVVDSENNRVNIFELTHGDTCPSGTDEVINNQVCFDESFGSSGNDDGEFDVPTDLAVSLDNGDIYVVDSDNNRVQRFQSDGDFDNLEFGSSRSSDDEYLGRPSAIAIDKRSDYIYVADSTTDSISAFDDDGDFLFSFGDTGSDDVEFRNPSAMVIDNTNHILYVADTDNRRIQMFALTDGDNCPSGTDEIVNDEVCLIDEFGAPGNDDGEFDEPSGLAFDEANSLLYVADTGNHRIQVFEIVPGTTCPSGTDEIINGVCFVDEFGSFGSGEGQFNSPTGLAIDPSNGRLYVADTGNHRVQILSTPFGGGHIPVDPEPTGIPTNLSAFPVSPTSIALTWDTPKQDGDTPETTGYKIESRQGNEPFATVMADTRSVLTSFTHTGLEEGKTYHYRVSAVNAEGVGRPSATAAAVPQATFAPAGLHAFPVSGSQIQLTWHPPSETFGQAIMGYGIEREVIPGVLFEYIATVSGDTTSYTVGGLETGKAYTYVVSAHLSIGNTPRSNAASATPVENAKPPAPLILSAGLAQPSYHSDEQIVFVGQENIGRQAVFVIVFDPLGRFVGVASDPVSNPDGSFETAPRPVEAIFSQVGTYTATVITQEQTESEGVQLQLVYDGEKVFEASAGMGLATLEPRRDRLSRLG